MRMKIMWSAGTLFLVGAIVFQAKMTGTAVEPVRPGLTIANPGTKNPTLLYHGEPMLRIGSVSEQGFFAFWWTI